MKIKTSFLLFSQAAPLLLITCATLACALFSLGSVEAQSAGAIINNNLVNSGGTIQFGISHQSIYSQIPTDSNYTISEQLTPLTLNTSFTCNNLAFEAQTLLLLDGTLIVKNISCDAPNAKMILCPHALVDLQGSTLVASSLTLADGTEIINGTYSFNDGDNVSPVLADRLDTIPSYKLSNGSKLIHGTLVIDSTQANALHLIESNEHRNPSSEIITMIPNYPDGISSTSVSSGSIILNNQNK